MGIVINLSGGRGVAKLAGIEISTPPNTTTYLILETFDPTGMVVTATYTDGTTKPITGYTYSPDGELSTSDKVVTISYTENEITQTATQKITVNDYTSVELPTQSGTLTYTGNALSPTWSGYDTDAMTVSGTTSGTDAGSYTATFALKYGHKWSDGTMEPKSATWTIDRATIAVPTQSGSLTYTGSSQSPTWSGYDASTMTISGTTSSINAGTYAVTFTPAENYQWSDSSTTGKTVSWKIGRATVAVPAQSGTLTYTGSAQSPTWSNYDSAKLTIGGVTSGTDAGTYSTTFTPTSNYQWSGGSTSAKTVTWTIGRATITVPTQYTQTYTGYTQYAYYDSSTMTASGTYSATDAGTYTATLTPQSNYQWSDGSTYGVDVTWTIYRATISVPTQSGSLTYTGSSQSPTWSGYDSAKMTYAGTKTAVKAGTYTSKFTPRDNYQWSDGTTSTKTATWTIEKATGSITSVSPESLTLNSTTGESGTVTVTYLGDGELTAVTWYHEQLADPIVSGNVITVTANTVGVNMNTKIRVSIGEGTNYTATGVMEYYVYLTKS
jgi:hypothetical protein